MIAATALCKCGHPFSEHSDYDDVPCEADHFRPPGTFVACECPGFEAAKASTAARLRDVTSELEARQNELYLAMRAVEEMPASEAQTACIVKLSARMRCLVGMLGKSEVGRTLDCGGNCGEWCPCAEGGEASV